MMENEPKLSNVLKLQSILRAFLAARKEEEKHILRTKIANELLETELNYTRDIRTIHWEYHLGSGEVLTLQEQDVLFMNIGEIVALHTDFAKELQERIRKWSYHQTVGDVIEEHIERFRIYERYITNYKEAADFLRRSRSSSKIDKYLQSREKNHYSRGMKLESFLVMPVQRLPRYLLLLKELRKYTEPDHPDYAFISSALNNLDELAKRLNEMQRDKETQYKISQILATVHGADEIALESTFMHEGPISVKKIKILKPGLIRSLSRGKELTKEIWNDLYLFKDTMLCAKKIGAASPKTIMSAIHGKGFYKFSTTKAHALSASTRLEISAEDPCKFKLVNESTAHEFWTATPQERDHWVIAFAATLVSCK